MSGDEPLANEAELIERFQQGMSNFVPHNRELGLQVTGIGRDYATMRLPYAERLIGNPVTGVLHGGVITTLMDACCGVAVFVKARVPMPIATLDLRIDYLRPATPGLDVTARCICFKVTRSVAFVRGLAYHDDESDPIAAAAGSFMIRTKPGKTRGLMEQK